MRPPREIIFAGDAVLSGIIGPEPSSPPKFSSSPGILADGGNEPDRSRLGVHHADSRLICDNRRENFCGCVAGNDYHIETDGADRRHRFELLYLQCARACGVYHSGVLGDGDKRAGETADMRRCHRAALFDCVVEQGERRCRAVSAALFETYLFEYMRTESPTAGVGASERSTMPKGTSSLREASLAMS